MWRAIPVLLAAALVALGATGCSASSAGAGAPSDAAVRAALTAQARAVLGHDRAAFAAGLDGASNAAGFRAAQLGAYANLVQLPLTHFSYALGPAVTYQQAQAAARKAFGPTARIVRLTLSYALRGVDPHPTQHVLWWTVLRHDGRVVVAADNGLAQDGGVSWQGPWDFGPLAVAHGHASLVLGPLALADELPSIAAEVDAAIPRVSAVWGSAWTRYVGVIVASTSAGLEADLNTTSPVPDAGSIAALAVNDGIDPLSGAVLGQRLVVDQSGYAQLTALGQRITITHEITHIASAAVTGAGMPRWLIEGLAEYVANLATGLSPPATAAELAGQVRAGTVPDSLPADSEFDAGGTTAAVAYEQAWLACRLIAATVGASGLDAFYRSVGTSSQPTDAAVAAAMQAVLHTSTAAFTARWRAYLRLVLR